MSSSAATCSRCSYVQSEWQLEGTWEGYGNHFVLLCIFFIDHVRFDTLIRIYQAWVHYSKGACRFHAFPSPYRALVRFAFSARKSRFARPPWQGAKNRRRRYPYASRIFSLPLSLLIEFPAAASRGEGNIENGSSKCQLILIPEQKAKGSHAIGIRKQERHNRLSPEFSSPAA